MLRWASCVVFKDCIERYGTLHRTVKRLCREGPAAVEAEARVCEAEALAVSPSRGQMVLVYSCSSSVILQ